MKEFAWLCLDGMFLHSLAMASTLWNFASAMALAICPVVASSPRMWGDDVTVVPVRKEADSDFGIGCISSALIADHNIWTIGANLDFSDVDSTINAEILGTGAQTKTGMGRLLLSGNAYSGGTIMKGGTLSVAGNDNLGAASGNLFFDGGTPLTYTKAFTTDRDVLQFRLHSIPEPSS